MSKTRKSRGRLKHARYSTTCYEYIKTWTALTRASRKGWPGYPLCFCSTIREFRTITLRCTRRHFTLSWDCWMYMNILLTRASSYKSCLLLDLPPLRDYFVVSFHMMIIENGPVDPGTINEGGHQPTGSMRGHIPRQARATRLLTRSMQRWEFPKIYLTAVVFILNNTRGASPRRDDARFCSAHARNYRGCRQIEAVNVTQYVLPRGTICLLYTSPSPRD